MALTQTTVRLANRDLSTGDLHATTIRAMLSSPIRRSLGASGDPINLTVEASEWPAGWKHDGEFIVKINDGEVDGGSQPINELDIEGYRLKLKMPLGIGNDLGDAEGTPEAKQLAIVLEAQIAGLRQGLGNLINLGTVNDLDENGEVDTAGDNYYTIQQLVETALSATGFEYEGAPAGINSDVTGTPIDAPGPLDWGNARPIDELEAILGRIGWSLVQLNDGTIASRPLLRAGEPIEIPTAFETIAEPYELASTPAIKGSKIIITSGATRATTITKRTLEDLEFVTYDPETDAWSTQTGTALSLYKGGITPDDVNPDGARTLGQLYKALRLTGDDLVEASRFVNIPESLDHGALLQFAGSAGVVEALCCVKQGGDQLTNTPPLDTDSLIRLEGLRAIGGKGVFVLPSDAEFVRISGMVTGRRSDVRELDDDELQITFAHESNTGVYREDYFAVGFEWVDDEGTITIETMETEDVDDALEDPSVRKLGAPFLRRVQTYDKDTDTLTTLNSTQLTTIAKQLASAYLSEDLAQAGVIVLPGIHDINPGDWSGAVTSVTFDVLSNKTIVTVNQHEVPRSEYERLERAAGRSIASGIGAIRLNRSSAAGTDARHTMSATHQGGGETAATPEQMPQSRGREHTVAGVQGSIDSGPRARVDMPTIAEQGMIFARITDATLDGTNRWIYDWEEVRFEDDEPVTTGAVRTSDTHGQAMNLREMLNDGTGVQGNGVDVANLPSGFAIQPVSGRGAVILFGPYQDGGEDRWYFQSTNGVDGSCT